MVRAAAAALRRVAREVPRGPWRWARPDLQVDEPSLTDIPPVARGLLPDDPLDLTPELTPPRPAAGALAELVHPEIADALATLLDQLAHRIEDGDVAWEVGRSAVALARIVLHTDATP